ncbi:hypothetical protein OPIT5_27420 [Opitutaceae bacterium TAV5]|nr:hypothetical protein OPIT5_27420 [Opitutaceae bacterium TAV5]
MDADGNLAFSNNPSFFSFPPDYSQVPESATYAILIGALALGFVGYRRWKLNREVLAA